MKHFIKALRLCTLILVAVCLAAVTAAPAVLAAESGSASGNNTFYIDSVNGSDKNNGLSQSHAWKTLEKVNSTVFSAGDSILFKSGCTFIGQLMLKGSGSADGAISVGKYGGDEFPVINANGATENGGAAVLLMNQEYIEISALEITNFSSDNGVRNGILVVEKDYGIAGHIYIENCYIHDIAATGDKTLLSEPTENGGDADIMLNNAGGIIFRAVKGSKGIPTAFRDIRITNNTITRTGIIGDGISFRSDWSSEELPGKIGEALYPSENIYIGGNDLSNTWTAIFLSAMDGTVGEGVIVEHNVSYKPDNNDSNAAMWLCNSEGVVWQYNEIYGLDNDGTNDCCAFDADGGAKNCVFQYNYTHDNRGEPMMVCNIYWDSKWTSPNAIGNIYRYNISQNDMWGAPKSHGRFWVQKGSSDSWFYNNVVYVGEGLGGDNIAIMESDSTHILNNIFIVQSDKTGYTVSDKAEYEIAGNCFYGYHPSSEPTGNNLYYNTDTQLSSIIQAAGEGSNGIDTLGGYRLADGSPCIGGGVNVSENGGLDFYGNVVPQQGNPDIGAYQSATGKDTEVPGRINDLSVTERTAEALTLSWAAVTDNTAVAGYAVYCDGKRLGTTNRMTYTVAGLKPDTEYRLDVRPFDGSGNTSGSNIVTAVTAVMDAKAKKLHVSEIRSIDSSGNNCTAFSAGDYTGAWIRVADGNGTPVENVLVRVQTEALGQEYVISKTAITDKDGKAGIGFTSEMFPGTVTYRITVTALEKSGCTFDTADGGNTSHTDVSVKGSNTSLLGALVRNPGMETTDSDTGLPKSWSFAAGNNDNAIRTAADAGRSGNALEISSEKPYSVLVMQNRTGIPNGTYILTAWVKNTNPFAKMSIQNTGGLSDSVTLPVTTQWRQVAIGNISILSKRASIRFTSSGSGAEDGYTLIDDVEFSINLIKNPDFSALYPSSNLPTDFTYTAGDKTVSIGETDLSGMADNVSLKAVKVLPSYTNDFKNVLRIGGTESFSLTMSQGFYGLPDGVYSLNATVVSTGGVSGCFKVKSGGKTSEQSVTTGSSPHIVKVGGVVVSGSSATIEFDFSGNGSADDYILIYDLGFSSRYDYPETNRSLILAGQNLLSAFNPGFEVDNAPVSGAPSGWFSNWTTNDATVDVTDEEKHSGGYSMKISLTGKEDSLNIYPGNYTVTGLPNGMYTFGAWIKSSYGVKLCATPDNRNERDCFSPSDNQWHYVIIPDIPVSDGVIKVSFWNTLQSGDSGVAYIDDAQLYLQDEIIRNGGFESDEYKDNIPVNWKTEGAEGFAYWQNTSDASEGAKALRAVLPGSPSTLTLGYSASLKNMQKGCYVFSIWIKGRSSVELFAQTDIGRVSKVYQGSEQWRQVTLDGLKINDTIRSIGVVAKNPDNVTSSYIMLDKASLTQVIRAADIADNLDRELTAVPSGAKAVELPDMPDGFHVGIISSSDERIVALDGSVRTPEKTVKVMLTLRVYNNADPNDYADAQNISVMVMGKNTEKVTEQTSNSPTTGDSARLLYTGIILAFFSMIGFSIGFFIRKTGTKNRTTFFSLLSRTTL